MSNNRPPNYPDKNRAKRPIGTVSFHRFTIAGMNLIDYLIEIKMYQSIMRPYIVCDFIMADRQGFGNKIKLSGGEPVEFLVESRDRIMLQWKGNVTKQDGEMVLEEKKARGTTITATNQAYLHNEINKVTGSWKNVPGSSVIQEIHKTYLGGEPMHRFSPSAGMIGMQQPFVVRDEKPFNAITKIRNEITAAAAAKSGAYTYFRDINGYVLMPLEQLFAEAFGRTFYEDERMGTELSDAFRTHDRMLDFKAMTTFEGSSTGIAAIASAMGNQMTNLLEAQSQKFTKGQPTSPGAPNISGVTGAIGGAFGFKPVINSLLNYVLHDKQRVGPISQKAQKAPGEKAMGETVQNGPGYKMAVLFDLGAELTVGRGVVANVIPPSAGTQRGMRNMPKDGAGGLGLIVNLTHTLKNVADTRPEGITVVECSQGGFRW